MRRLSASLSLALLPLLAGCFTIASTITVRPDGSGTLRDVVEVNGMGLLAMTDEDNGDSLVTAAQLKARAATLGAGVTLVGIESGDAGYTAVYAFSDVRDLQYRMPDLNLGEDDGDETVADEAFDLLFDFEDSDPATLSIIVPDNDDEAGAEVEDQPEAEMTEEELENAERGLQIMRAMMGDARMTVEVVLDGDVTETDATYAEGSTVTLIDVEFDRLLDVLEENPELMQGDEPPTGQLHALLAGREGVVLQEPGVVTVRFE